MSIHAKTRTDRRGRLAPALLALFALMVQAAIPSAAMAAGPAGLSVIQPWSRPASAGSTGAGYLTLVNGGRQPLVLTGVESPVAARVEMHNSTMAGGVMRMAREDRVVIAPGAKVVFGPGGRHLMLVGLRQALKPGDRVPATLAFAGGRTVKVEFVVGNGLGAPEMGHSHP